MRDEFAVHMLNDAGKSKAAAMAEAFSACLDAVEKIAGVKDTGSELAIVRTKLREAAFFAKRAVAIQKENQA